MLGALPTLTDEVACVEIPSAIERVNEFGYLATNPDVRESGLSARDHFKSVGRAEGRVQAINIDRIARLRDRKLAGIAFSRTPLAARRQGEPFNFLSADMLEEFAIPSAPAVSSHPYPDSVIHLIRDNPDKLFLDVGAGLRPTYYGNVVNTEIYPSVSTDVLCVGEAMPFAPEQFDYVFCFATLEHTKRPWDVADEICRVLKPGGTVMIDYPFMQPVHGYPHHYFNATPKGNRSLFERACDIQSVEIGWHQHPMIGLQWILTVFHRGLQPADATLFENLRIKDIVATPLDELLKAPYCVNLHEAMRSVIASGSFLTATKKQNSGRGTQHPGSGPHVGRSGLVQDDPPRRTAALGMERGDSRQPTAGRVASLLRAGRSLFPSRPL